MTGRRVIVDIRITAEEYQKMYAGVAHNVNVRARDGRRVSFPANILRQFVARTGIVGSFQIEFDHQMKFQGIHRL